MNDARELTSTTKNPWKLQLNKNLISIGDNDEHHDVDGKQLLDFLKQSSCPPDDDVRKLAPWQIRRQSDNAGDNNAHDNNDNNNGMDVNNSRQFYVYFPPRLCSSLQGNNHESNNGTSSLPSKSLPSIPRVILAFHGFGGRPNGELQKFHRDHSNEEDDDDETIMIAPQGTLTPSVNKLGWNANNCCGDPVVNGVKDVEFVLEGVIPLFSGVYHSIAEFIVDGNENADESGATKAGEKSFGNMIRNNNHQITPENIMDDRDIHVIATGFSNGGFFSSLLGLLPSEKRPEWLIGIVPTGGYQYNASLYGFDDNQNALDASNNKQQLEQHPNPLPIMMHHGGRDSVVRPEGCCNSQPIPQGGVDKQSNKRKSNCIFDIGIHQSTCTSVQHAFDFWSQINGCDSTSETTAAFTENYHPLHQRRLAEKNKVKDNSNPHTCWKGNRCTSPTIFCLWENEGHAWGGGGSFPGLEMARNWMDGVFIDAELRKKSVPSMAHQDSGSPSSFFAWVDSSSQKGRVVFSELVTCLFFVIFAIIILFFRSSREMKFCGLCRKVGKRKTSEEFGLDREEEDRILE